MSHRFVYTDPDGREVRLVTQADLERAVAEGEISDATPLFDEVAAELAPARGHDAYRRARDAVAARGGFRTTGEDEDLTLEGLTLAAPLADPTVDDTVRDFKERLERERRQARELDPGAGRADLGMVRGDTVADIADPEKAAPSASEGSPSDGTSSRGTPSGAEPATTRRPGSSIADRAAPLFPGPNADAPDADAVRPTGMDRGMLRQVAIFAALVGVGAWGIADARATATDAAAASEVLYLEASQASGPPPAGLLDVRASSEAAFRDMRDGMQRIRSVMEVVQPPSSWLSGEYLSDPMSAPEVRDFWLRYETFVDSIRAAEEDLFRSGFASRLQEVGITGPVLSIRLARGLTDFRADRPRREDVYSAMEGLAREALSLDTWLRSVPGRIAYAGVREDALSMAPGLEAAALDEQTASELDRRLDAVLDALDRVTGFDPAESADPTGRALGELGGDGSGR